jgi:hypothetical protein
MEVPSILIKIIHSLIDRYQLSGYEIGSLLLSTIILIICLFYFISTIIKSTTHVNELNKSVPKWPITPGVITESFMVDSSIETPSWTHFIQFKFVLHDIEYTSDTITFFDNSTYYNKEECRRAVEKYPVNSIVQVRYNPLNPQECCLYQNKHVSIIPVFIFRFLIFLLFAPMTFFISYSAILSGKLFYQFLCFGYLVFMLGGIIYLERRKFVK